MAGFFEVALCGEGGEGQAAIISGDQVLWDRGRVINTQLTLPAETISPLLPGPYSPFFVFLFYFIFFERRLFTLIK